MGCPDWPKCFNQWIPPTSIEQLPADYKEKFAAFRERKNKKFAGYLSTFGMHETANRILTDESIKVEADFNATKTWIEYLNRLLGVVIGFLIIAVVIRSIQFRKQRPFLFWMSVLTLITVIFQGWLGSIVVSTNLTSWTITIHMFVALAIVAMLAALVHSAGEKQEVHVKPGTKAILLICMVLLLVQVFLGTEVRTAIDHLTEQSLPRYEWISGVWGQFLIHRTFSWLVLIFHALLIFQIRKTSAWNTLSGSLIVLILLTLLSGIGMAYFGVPAFLQPVHLLVAAVTFALQFLLLLRFNTSRVNDVNKLVYDTAN